MTSAEDLRLLPARGSAPAAAGAPAYVEVGPLAPALDGPLENPLRSGATRGTPLAGPRAYMAQGAAAMPTPPGSLKVNGGEGEEAEAAAAAGEDDEARRYGAYEARYRTLDTTMLRLVVAQIAVLFPFGFLHWFDLPKRRGRVHAHVALGLLALSTLFLLFFNVYGFAFVPAMVVAATSAVIGLEHARLEELMRRTNNDRFVRTYGDRLDETFEAKEAKYRHLDGVMGGLALAQIVLWFPLGLVYAVGLRERRSDKHFKIGIAFLALSTALFLLLFVFVPVLMLIAVPPMLLAATSVGVATVHMWLEHDMLHLDRNRFLEKFGVRFPSQV